MDIISHKRWLITWPTKGKFEIEHFNSLKIQGDYGCCVMKFIKATKAQIIDTTPYHNLRWLLKVITTTRGSFLCVLKQQKLKQLVWCTHLHALHAVCARIYGAWYFDGLLLHTLLF